MHGEAVYSWLGCGGTQKKTKSFFWLSALDKINTLANVLMTNAMCKFNLREHLRSQSTTVQ